MAESKRKTGQTARATLAKGGAMREADYTALAQFRYQLRTFLAFSEAAAQNAGLTPQQHQALLAIKGLAGPDGASVGDLAGFLLIRHHTAVELVDRMAKLKLISREADPEDARRVLVKLTAKGEQKLRSLSRIHLDELSAAAPALAKILRSFRAKSR
ncbi:MarR family transcriptional regulator [Bradyrhizobium sp. WBOS7]|uniref:MarR family transcriptional regulator n=1 Tax=Bradyrhizobium betae TaxID=244734 RepID=A0AAE9N4W8_9BRAD|nr:MULTISPECIES: MarR family winged helix-turn-helix transcriptional regulator [Bradyrhizobium]MDD1574285.1 MarR family transcriptional regulator [Bradyrhizobium sp. WBOS1]UUO33699.1 MarR family transcriptional regulator [Bradyrhizobium sp. WBOS01]MDD1529993.1 MarR family transcriptional regulator [Bradyrhizobium sp. WBOS2]MDD1579251.1 MarR family transcriptional regulator [Bradyrhizobium sp. WBOS7]MDD1603549.1 MarR family transcriptional regulator [Bradyrhizobium sp. WBOS16]